MNIKIIPTPDGGAEIKYYVNGVKNTFVVKHECIDMLMDFVNEIIKKIKDSDNDSFFQNKKEILTCQ